MFTFDDLLSGTGKTRTILAMVSTLMHLGQHSPLSSQKQDSSQPPAPSTVTSRLLVCAPSNAAVDELLLRLLKEGVVSASGKVKKPKLVRLGKPLENSPQEIIDMTLENQVTLLLQRDPAWKKLQKALEATSSLKSQLGSGSGSALLTTEKRRKLRSDLRLANGCKISAELQVSLRRVELRKMLLETCDVLAGHSCCRFIYIIPYICNFSLNVPWSLSTLLSLQAHYRLLGSTLS